MPSFRWTSHFVLRTRGNRLSSYFGLMKCKILQPYGFYHPVLPYPSGGKHIFPRCIKCVEVERSNHCVHDDLERCLKSTCPAPKLEEAIEQGYVIQQIPEIWRFSRISDGMFSFYANAFLKMKQEARGDPIGGVTTSINASNTSPSH